MIFVHEKRDRLENSLLQGRVLGFNPCKNSVLAYFSSVSIHFEDHFWIFFLSLWLLHGFACRFPDLRVCSTHCPKRQTIRVYGFNHLSGSVDNIRLYLQQMFSQTSASMCSIEQRSFSQIVFNSKVFFPESTWRIFSLV